MYVCVCHGINERDVAKATCNGACKAADVFRQHGVRPKCGRCLSTLRNMVGEGCADTRQNAPANAWHNAQSADVMLG